MDRAPSRLWEGIVPWVDPEQCRRCADCPAIAACLAQSIRRGDPDGVPAVDVDLCYGCHSCVGACPYRAVIPPRAGGA